MKRYTQGFKFFGPMEQCKDGEWCKYDEAYGEIYRRERSMDMAERKIIRLQNECKDWSLAFKFLLLMNVGIIIGIIFTEYLV